MKPIRSLVLVITFVGCASQPPAKPTEGPPLAGVPMDTSYRPGSRAVRIGDETEAQSRDGLTMDAEHGTLDQGEVESVLEKNARTFSKCYERGGDAQKYVGGQVLLKFLVSPEGHIDDVLITENTLGHYAIERCLVVEARHLQFPRPSGGKAAEFQYTLRFRSTGEMSVVDVPDDSIHAQVMPLLAQLEPCPRLGPADVTAIIYVAPDGTIPSAGLVSPGAVDPEAGVCALEQVRKWRLVGDQGHVIRATFGLRPPTASEAAAARPAPRPSVHAGRKAPAKKKTR